MNSVFTSPPPHLGWRRQRAVIVWVLSVNAVISQEDTRLLRRTLVEKRPVIENKLLTGRQLLASETAPSDTSDSDSE